MARDPQRIEIEIAAVEKRMTALSEEMGTPEVSRAPQQFAVLNREYQEAEARLRALYEEWERVAAEASKT